MREIPNARVKEVLIGSIADEAGIETGDIIVNVNGERFKDILEFIFLVSDEDIELEVLKSDGTCEYISIYNEEYEDLGIVFENPMIDKPKACRNNCIFCFIDQLPKGLRKTLYFKDDDLRLSILQGNYITLTNMLDDDIDRVVRFRLSPVNISVHTTNPKLREEILRNKNAGKINEYITRLHNSHITMNCQIVLMRDINDRIELDRTIRDVAFLYPYVKSVSVVPVGITRYRQGKYDLVPFDKASAMEVIAQVTAWQRKLFKKFGSRVVYLADEFYILAGVEIPQHDHYEDFPQIENGVGLIASMENEFLEGLKHIDSSKSYDEKKVSIATGFASFEFIASLCLRLKEKIKGLNINVYPIKNTFFGENITVSGLITGSDLIEQLKGNYLGDKLFIPAVMLRSERDIFLDDIRIEQIEKELNIKVEIVNNDGYEFIEKITGEKVIGGSRCLSQ